MTHIRPLRDPVRNMGGEPTLNGRGPTPGKARALKKSYSQQRQDMPAAPRRQVGLVLRSIHDEAGRWQGLEVSRA